MDPNSLTSKMDQLVKAAVIAAITLTVCVGFLLGKVSSDWFMPIAYTVFGAAFARTMAMLPSAITKTTEVGPDGVKKETSITAPLGIPPTPPPTKTNGGTT